MTFAGIVKDKTTSQIVNIFFDLFIITNTTHNVLNIQYVFRFNDHLKKFLYT